MDFSVACAYAHGTAALRTHLINMAPKQLQLTWPAFSRLRTKWAGKVRKRARGRRSQSRACGLLVDWAPIPPSCALGIQQWPHCTAQKSIGRRSRSQRQQGNLLLTQSIPLAGA